MEAFVARQPIFTKTKDIFGYELLYRNSLENHFSNINGDVATTDVIVNSFINIGIDELSNGKPCFVNFTGNLLQQRLPTYFQPNEVIVEILESVELNQELLDICRELKEKGYQIALDDFVLQEKNPYTYPLLDLANIIKVDFRSSAVQMRRVIEHFAHKHNYQLLAEKIETTEEFDSAAKLGYQYFQGFYFSKPVVLSTHDVPDYLQNYFIIINQLEKSEPDLDFITSLIEQDVSLSYKLLKLINSPAFLHRSRISSIRQAIVRLGFTELKKWLYILSIRGTTSGKSEWSKEIFNNSLVRAKMCEFIALHQHLRIEASAYFLTGLFSLMDVLLGMEMSKIITLMPLQEDISEALKGNSNRMRNALELTIHFERGDWEEVRSLCHRLQIEEAAALDYYYRSLKWANNLMKE